MPVFYQPRHRIVTPPLGDRVTRPAPADVPPSLDASSMARTNREQSPTTPDLFYISSERRSHSGGFESGSRPGTSTARRNPSSTSAVPGWSAHRPSGSGKTNVSGRGVGSSGGTVDMAGTGPGGESRNVPAPVARVKTKRRPP